jgi:hypothetical protein
MSELHGDVQHHFEVVVNVDHDTGKIEHEAYVNSEFAATWWEGTLWESHRGEWFGGQNDEGIIDNLPAAYELDCQASHRLRAILNLPITLANMLDETSKHGEWDGAEVCDALGRILHDLGVIQVCGLCGFVRSIEKQVCWCGAGAPLPAPNAADLVSVTP